ncbi:MAG: type ISP restriction/modification enzyme, partial [Dolichospermum sp.]
KEKLDIIKGFGDVSTIQWSEITPNENYDWINQRNDDFESFISLGDKKDVTTKTIFDVYSRGLETTRDSWVYNFSQQSVIDNMMRMIDFYNQQVEGFKEYLKDKIVANNKDKEKLVESFVDTDTKKISWSSSLKQQLQRLKLIEYQEKSISQGIYRPFCKQWIYFDNYLNHRVGQIPKFYPNQSIENLVICVTGIGVTKDFNAVIVNIIPDVQLQANSQCFPLYTYEKQSELGELFAT